jgi:predicted HicB family RNase H-like nuclease
VFGARAELALRLSVELHQRLTAVAEAGPMSTVQYVTTVLELAVLERPDALALGAFRDGARGDRRIHVAIRMLPSLHAQLKAEAKRAGVSVNRYVAFALAEALDG